MATETPFCRICHDDDTHPNEKLFRPCRCRGTSGFVHRACLDRWRQMNRDTERELFCDICKYRYKISGGCRNSVIYKIISHIWCYSSFGSRNVSSSVSLSTLVNLMVFIKFTGRRLISKEWPSVHELIMRSSAQLTSTRAGCFFIIFHLNTLIRELVNSNITHGSVILIRTFVVVFLKLVPGQIAQRLSDVALYKLFPNRYKMLPRERHNFFTMTFNIILKNYWDIFNAMLWYRVWREIGLLWRDRVLEYSPKDDRTLHLTGSDE